MSKASEGDRTVVTAGKAIRELLDANTALMKAWYAEHANDQKIKAEEIVKAARARQRAAEPE